MNMELFRSYIKWRQAYTVPQPKEKDAAKEKEKPKRITRGRMGASNHLNVEMLEESKEVQ